MCAVAQSTPEHQGASELPGIPILGTSVNRGGKRPQFLQERTGLTLRSTPTDEALCALCIRHSAYLENLREIATWQMAQPSLLDNLCLQQESNLRKLCKSLPSCKEERAKNGLKERDV